MAAEIPRRGKLRPISQLPSFAGGAALVEVEQGGQFYQGAYGAGVTDPFAPFVATLLTFDGANNATSFSDAVSLSKGYTCYGACKLTNAQSKFGSTSLLLGSTFAADRCEEIGWGSSLVGTNPNVTNFDVNLGAGEFTLEFWIYRTAGHNASSLISFVINRVQTTGGLTREWSVYLENYNVQLYYGVRGSSSTVRTFAFNSTTLPDGQWNHVCLTRTYVQGTLLISCYVNGAVSSSGSYLNDSTDLSYYTFGTMTSNFVRIGGWPFAGSGAVNCYLGGLRLTKKARYYGTFTPPTRQFSL